MSIQVEWAIQTALIMVRRICIYELSTDSDMFRLTGMHLFKCAL